MSRLSALVVISDTELITRQGIWEKHPKAWAALLDWCRIHGIDPNHIPVSNRIVRNLERCRVEFDTYVLTDAGRLQIDQDAAPSDCLKARVHVQGETPPLPWPFETVDWR